MDCTRFTLGHKQYYVKCNESKVQGTHTLSHLFFSAHKHRLVHLQVCATIGGCDLPTTHKTTQAYMYRVSVRVGENKYFKSPNGVCI